MGTVLFFTNNFFSEHNISKPDIPLERRPKKLSYSRKTVYQKSSESHLWPIKRRGQKIVRKKIAPWMGTPKNNLFLWA